MLASSPSIPSSSGCSDGAPNNKSSPTTSPSTTQQSQSQSHKTPTSSSTRTKRIRRPATNSLNGILRKHAGTALFVRPAYWTDLHTGLIGAEFNELPPCNTPLPQNIPGSPPSQGHMQPSQTIIKLSDALTEILSPSSPFPAHSAEAVKTALKTLWPQAFDSASVLPEMHVYFGSKVYHDAVRVQLLFNFPQSQNSRVSSQSSFQTIATKPAESHRLPSCSPAVHNLANLPMLCYVGKDQLAAIRQNIFRVPKAPGADRNFVISRLQKLRAKKLLPADTDRDAHFVAILLSMAQRHFYAPPTPCRRRESYWSPCKDRVPHPDFCDLKLRLLTHDNNTSEFLVYTGYITAGFLERFFNPKKAPATEDGTGAPGLKIEYTRVPIWPILGLRERLGKAIGEDVVGPFDADKMETWEDDAETKQTNMKRKRDALSQALHSSFNKSLGSDSQELSRKKRCIRESNRVSLVV